MRSCSSVGFLSVTITHASLGMPMIPDKDRSATERRVFPSEVSFLTLLASAASQSADPDYVFQTQARERLTSYRSRLNVRIRWTVTGPDNDPVVFEENRDCGLLPVMVRVSHGG